MDDDIDKFDEDLTDFITRICDEGEAGIREKLEQMKARLIELGKRNLVKVNHSVMELLCSKHLMVKGYDVDIEHSLGGSLVCDIYASKGAGTMIVEVETGYTSPEHALDPRSYNVARIASKIARYSTFANKFALGTSPTNLLEIPPIFRKPPKFRAEDEVTKVKRLCDRYYRNPPISVDEIRNANLHAIYIVDVDGQAVREVDPEIYIEAISSIPFIALHVL